MNFSCLLSLAALRTPPSPCDTLFPLGVGLVLDPSAFSLVCALSSPSSAKGFPSLFGRLTGTTAPFRYAWQTPLERTCPPFGLSPSRTGLDQIETLQRSPGSRACCFSTCSGSSTTQGRTLTREYRERPCCLPFSQTRSAPWNNFFSKLNSPARRYPCLRFDRRLATPSAKLGVKVVRCLLPCRTLSVGSRTGAVAREDIGLAVSGVSPCVPV